MNCAHCRQLLDAWLDGEVDGATADSIEGHFSRCSECEAARRERETLRSFVRAAARPEKVPADVSARIRARLGAEAAAPQRSRSRPSWTAAGAMAAASAAFAAFVTVAILHPGARPEAALEQLVDRHVAALSAGASSGTPLVQFPASEQHQLKPWFQGRVPLSPPVVDLSSAGFELLGGRVERVGSHETAVVVYRVRKHPIDVFAWRDSAPDAMAQAATLRGFSVVRWNAGGIAFAAVSDLNVTELERFARLLAPGST